MDKESFIMLNGGQHNSDQGELLTENEIKAIYRDSFYTVDSRRWNKATRNRFKANEVEIH